MRLTTAERAVIGYAMLAAVVSAVRAPTYPNAWFSVGAHLLIVLLVVLVAEQARASGLVRRLRPALPLVLLIALYTLLDIVNLAGNVRTWDREIQVVEQALTGGQPARDWWRTSPSVFWSTLLHAAYFAYYALIAVPALLILATGTAEERELFTTRVIVCFMLCYAVFALFPVSGPYYQFAQPSGAFIDNLPARLVYASLSGGSSFGAAFPSSHVAATVTCTVVMVRLRPRVGVWLVLPAVLLTVSVVYCAMHYAVDAVAGLALGLVVGALPLRRSPA